MRSSEDKRSPVAVIGGGPAGLMAAEVLAEGGSRVDVYDAMPSVGRKLLQAGVGGANLTHAEPIDDFLARYGSRTRFLEPLLREFGPKQLRAWVADLGVDTFIGSSGRVFPTEMKAAPLLRAWLRRLRAAGVRFHMRHRWVGWNEQGELRFSTPEGERGAGPGAVVFALGGGSWRRLGSDGLWVEPFRRQRVAVAPLRPSNCGFDVGWSEHFRGRYAGEPVKPVVAVTRGPGEGGRRRQGEFNVTATGVEGGVIYAFSAELRDAIDRQGSTTLRVDLVPGMSVERLRERLQKPRGSNSVAKHLRRRARIEGVKAGLLREVLSPEDFREPGRLAAALKDLPLRLVAPRPLDEAISSAGGVSFDALDDSLMLRALPGTFCAGEMLDWEAPTGGYLLTACLATGRTAGRGALGWLRQA